MKTLHSWSLSPDEALKIQTALRDQLMLAWDGREVGTIGGVDVSIKGDTAIAAIVVLKYPELNLVDCVIADASLTFPYIPGLLTFREGPVILAAWKRLVLQPDLLMFDGQGIAHPRGMGIASQMGLWLNKPCIGVAKSRLYGIHTEPAPMRGSYSLLYDEHESERVIGAVVRTRDRIKPLYVSPGHLIDVEQAVRFVICCGCGVRLPEPTRLAHRFAGEKTETLP